MCKLYLIINLVSIIEAIYYILTLLQYLFPFMCEYNMVRSEDLSLHCVYLNTQYMLDGDTPSLWLLLLLLGLSVVFIHFLIPI